MEEVVAGAAAPWILERDKRTSFLVSGRREREETESRDGVLETVSVCWVDSWGWGWGFIFNLFF